MEQSNISSSTLPMLAMKEVPVARADAKQIVGVQKSKGRISGYQLSDGQLLSKEQGVSLARQGGIAGVGISERNGKEYLKSLPDGKNNNNLSSLPTVTG